MYPKVSALIVQRTVSATINRRIYSTFLDLLTLNICERYESFVSSVPRNLFLAWWTSLCFQVESCTDRYIQFIHELSDQASRYLFSLQMMEVKTTFDSLWETLIIAIINRIRLFIGSDMSVNSTNRYTAWYELHLHNSSDLLPYFAKWIIFKVFASILQKHASIVINSTKKAIISTVAFVSRQSFDKFNFDKRQLLLYWSIGDTQNFLLILLMVI